MDREIKTLDDANLIFTQMVGAAANIYYCSLFNFPTSEIDKIKTIEMTKEQFNIINSHCICIDITEDLSVYSCGGAPFKVNITDK